MEITGAIARRVDESGTEINILESIEELEVEIDRSSGRIFVKEGTNLMNYIKDGKVWVKK